MVHDVLSISVTLFDVGGVSLLEDQEGLSINDKFPMLSLGGALELVMAGIVLEYVDHVVAITEGGGP